MKNAIKLGLKIDVKKILLREENKLIWSNSYDKANSARIAKSPAAAKNAPKLPSIKPSYYVLEQDEADDFIDQLPPQIVAQDRPVVICNIFEAETPSQLCIHKDFGRSSSINVYIETSEEVTTFYDFDTQNFLVTPVESFCAETGDVWAMCSKTPHGVLFRKPATRIALNYSFKKLTYQNLLRLL